MTGTATQEQSARVDAAVLALARSGVLTSAQAAAVTKAVRAAMAGGEPAPRRRWPEILGYVGGAVTVVAVILLVSRSWDDLGPAGRSIVLGSTAVALIAAGAVIGGVVPQRLRRLRGPVEPERRRLVSTLFSAGVTAAGSAGGVASEGDHSLLIAGVIALALGTIAYVLVPSLLGQLVLLAAAVSTVTGVLIVAGVDTPVPYGLAVAAVGAVWLGLAWWGALAEPVAAVVLSLVVLFSGAQMVTSSDPVRTWGYAMTTATAVVAIAIYVRSRRWPVLAAGIVALMTVVLQVVLDVFGESLAALWVVLTIGLALLVVSGVVLRTRSGSAQS
jgi:hypothetical protein